MARRRLSTAARARATDALAALRNPLRYGKLPASEAAKQFGSSVRSMKGVAGRAMRKADRRWTYTPREDRGVRTTSILAKTPEGPRWTRVDVRGLDQARKAGRFARAIESGRGSRIEAFEGKYVTTTSGKRIYFETDLTTLRRLDREGGLRPEGLQFS